jgi:small subunit ribosomal protein S13
MPRIVGVDIPNNKSIWISLTYIYGIGKYTSEQVLKEAKVEKNAKAAKLSEDELSRITQIIERNYVVGGQLRRQTAQNIGCPFEASAPRAMREHAKAPEKQWQVKKV